MKKSVHLLVSLAVLSLGLIACDTEPVTDPTPFTVQNYVDSLIETSEGSAKLGAEAVKASGVYEDLDVNPLLLILPDGATALEDYIQEQGLTRESFLNHPKLKRFVNSHLIYDEVDLAALRSGDVGTSETFESAAGIPITITKVNNDPDGVDVKNGEANGVPMDLRCAGEGNGNPSTFVCFTTGPIAKNFDWSQ